MLTCFIIWNLLSGRKNNSDQRYNSATFSIMGEQLKVPWYPSDRHSTIVLRGLRGVLKKDLIRTPLCLKTPESRCIFFQFGLAFHLKFVLSSFNVRYKIGLRSFKFIISSFHVRFMFILNSFYIINKFISQF